MGRTSIVDPDAERPPPLHGLPVFDRLVADADGPLRQAAGGQGAPGMAAKARRGVGASVGAGAGAGAGPRGSAGSATRAAAGAAGGAARARSREPSDKSSGKPGGEPFGRSGTDALPNVALPFELRSRSRLRVRLSDGRDIAIVLPRGSVLRGGSVISDGQQMAAVLAADEDLIEVAADDAFRLARIAYHLGNRHVPVEVRPRSLLLGYDTVLVDMLVGLGAQVRRFWGPFEPEVGAYAHGH